MSLSGCPAALAVGRRKGLTGEATLCGTCGKYFHRYRKNRPCEYTTDFGFHQAFLASQAGPGKTRAGKGRAAKTKGLTPTPTPGSVPASVSFASTTSSIPPDGVSIVPGSEPTEGPSGATSQVTSVNPSRQPSVEHSDDDEDHSEDDDDDHDDDHSDSSSTGGKMRAPPRRAGHGIEDDNEEEELPYIRVGSPDSDRSSRRSASPPPDQSQGAGEATTALAAEPPTKESSPPKTVSRSLTRSRSPPFSTP